MKIARNIDDLSKLSVTEVRLLNLISWGYELTRNPDNTITAKHQSCDKSLPILLIHPAKGLLKKYWCNGDNILHRDCGMPSVLVYENRNLQSMAWHLYGKLLKIDYIK